jgi:hypothetical protein
VVTGFGKKFLAILDDLKKLQTETNNNENATTAPQKKIKKRRNY